jgi:hypothetical protein
MFHVKRANPVIEPAEIRYPGVIRTRSMTGTSAVSRETLPLVTNLAEVRYTPSSGPAQGPAGLMFHVKRAYPVIEPVET